MFNFLKDFVFPKSCLGCNADGSYLCAKCIKKIEILDFFICPVCRKKAVGGRTHPHCRGQYRLDGAISLFAYRRSLKELLKTLKFRFAYDMRLELNKLINGSLTKLRPNRIFYNFIAKKPLMVPVPLYWRRLNWRGFNQSELIAKIVAGCLKLKMDPGYLKRIKKTHPQSDLTKKERRANIKRAFRVNKKAGFKPEAVLLVDDIYTSGYTLQECGLVLKRAGARTVWALTLTR